MSTAGSPTPTKIIISIKDKSGDKVFYKVSCDMKLVKLLKNYSRDKNLVYETVDFLHEGERLQRRGTTVARAGLKDGDEIDVMEYMDGGGPLQSKWCKSSTITNKLMM